LKKLFTSYSLIFFLLFSQNSYAGLSLIRDAETEKFLHELADPIFKAADLDAKNIKIYIVNDDTLNAFVSGGQNVFLNTGLIRKYTTPDTLIGVIAHETGHIAAGHLARSSEAMENATGAMLLSYLLGIGAVVAGSPEAGQALILGGSNTAERMYMKFNRGQEEAADQRAIEYLGKMSYPADGLVNLLEFFESEMIGSKSQMDEYLMSHPVSKKRIDLIKARTLNVNFSDKKINRKLQRSMDIVLAKLEGYMENPDEILKKYQNQNDDLSNYKKSIAFSKQGKSTQSLELLDKVITNKSFERLKNITKNDNQIDSELGFLFELKGQILFESGQIIESTISYNRALKLLKEADASQSKISFSSAILSLKQDDSDLINLAIKNLEEAKEFEDDNPFLFKQLATAYSKIKDEGRSLLALAEFNLLIGQKDKSMKYAKEAKEKLDKSDKVNLLHADDLIELSKKMKGEKE